MNSFILFKFHKDKSCSVSPEFHVSVTLPVLRNWERGLCSIPKNRIHNAAVMFILNTRVEWYSTFCNFRNGHVAANQVYLYKLKLRKISKFGCVRAGHTCHVQKWPEQRTSRNSTLCPTPSTCPLFSFLYSQIKKICKLRSHFLLRPLTFEVQSVENN